MESTDRVVSETYLHVCNSGVTFKVLDTKYGPEVEISLGAFGSLESVIKLKTTREGLRDLERVFHVAALNDQKYSADYCHAAAPSNDCCAMAPMDKVL